MLDEDINSHSEKKVILILNPSNRWVKGYARTNEEKWNNKLVSYEQTQTDAEFVWLNVRNGN